MPRYKKQARLVQNRRRLKNSAPHCRRGDRDEPAEAPLPPLCWTIRRRTCHAYHPPPHVRTPPAAVLADPPHVPSAVLDDQA